MDTFVEQVVQDRDAAEELIKDLRAEVDRLHRYIRRQWSAVATAESASAPAGGRSAAGLVSPAAQAQAVLSQAQEIADRRLAQADARLTEVERQAADRLEYVDRQVQIKLVDADQQASRLIGVGEDTAAARLTAADAIAERVLLDARLEASTRRSRAEAEAERVLLVARTRYEDIVLRAHQRADRAAEAALADLQEPGPAGHPADGSRARVELEMKAAYLRIFAKVSRAALQAALDLTAPEFDRLLGVSASREAVDRSDEDPGPMIAAPRSVRRQARLIVLPDTEAAAVESPSTHARP